MLSTLNRESGGFSSFRTFLCLFVPFCNGGLDSQLLTPSPPCPLFQKLIKQQITKYDLILVMWRAYIELLLHTFCWNEKLNKRKNYIPVQLTQPIWFSVNTFQVIAELKAHILIHFENWEVFVCKGWYVIRKESFANSQNPQKKVFWTSKCFYDIDVLAQIQAQYQKEIRFYETYYWFGLIFTWLKNTSTDDLGQLPLYSTTI